jgi:hypothetical protein
MKGYIATKKLFERSYNWMLIFMDFNSLQSPPQRGRGGRRTAISCERGLRRASRTIPLIFPCPIIGQKCLLHNTTHMSGTHLSCSGHK